MTETSPREVLQLPLPENEGAWPEEYRTVGDFLTGLLSTLWQEQDQFSGKKPWGDSGWTSPIEIALINAKMVDGRLDEDGYLDDVDTKAVDRIILAAIAYMGDAT